MSEQAPERPAGGGGFSLTKRYGPLPAWAWGLLGGAGLYAGYRFWKVRQGAGAATAATTAAGDGQGTGIDYAPQIATIQSEVQQLQGEESTEPVDTDTDVDTGTGGPGPRPGGGGGGGGGGGKSVRVPDVVGQRAANAISTIEAAGLETVTSPFRDPKREYVVTGQTPKGGATVPRRTVVVLRVRVTSRAKPPQPRRPRQPAEIPGGPVARLR